MNIQEYRAYLNDISQQRFLLPSEILTYLCFRDFRKKQLEYCIFENAKDSLVSFENYVSFPQFLQTFYKQELFVCHQRLKVLSENYPKLFQEMENEYLLDLQSRKIYKLWKEEFLKGDSINQKNPQKISSEYIYSETEYIYSEISPEYSITVTSNLAFQDYLKLKESILNHEEKKNSHIKSNNLTTGIPKSLNGIQIPKMIDP